MLTRSCAPLPSPASSNQTGPSAAPVQLVSPKPLSQTREGATAQQTVILPPSPGTCMLQLRKAGFGPPSFSPVRVPVQSALVTQNGSSPKDGWAAASAQGPKLVQEGRMHDPWFSALSLSLSLSLVSLRKCQVVRSFPTFSSFVFRIFVHSTY